MGRPVLVHVHIFKNAGSTFDSTLRGHFGDRFREYDGGEAWHKVGAEELRKLISEHPETRVISSHQLRLPLPEIEGAELRPIVFIRDPLARAESVWSYECRQDAESPGAVHAKKLDLPGYVRWRLGQGKINVICDFQSEVIARDREANRIDFELAERRLRNAEVVGVVERMTETMVAAEHRLGRTFPGIQLQYVSRNVSPDAATPAERLQRFLNDLGPGLSEELRQRNARDVRLHAMANRELDRRLEAIADVDAALEDFERRCRELRSAEPTPAGAPR